MDLFEKNLIFIFMNINYNVENWGENQGKTIAIERFFGGLLDLSCILGQVSMAASLVRWTT